MPLHASSLSRAVSITVVAALALSGMVATSTSASADTPLAPGALDTSFNSNVGPRKGGNAFKIIKDSLGGYLVLTRSHESAAYPKYQLMRLAADGSQDMAFEANLEASGIFSLTYADSSIMAVAIDGNGKILVQGSSTNVPGYLVRLNPDGTEDLSESSGSTFRENTVAALANDTGTPKYLGISGYRTNYIIQVDSANNIFLLGPDSTSAHYGVTKYFPNGQLDTTWMEAAKTALACPSSAQYATLITMTLDAADRVVVAGGCNDRTTGYLRRLNTDGTLDTGFTPVVTREVGQIFVADGADVDTLPGDGDVFAGHRWTNSAPMLERFAGDTGATDTGWAATFTTWSDARVITWGSNNIPNGDFANGTEIYSIAADELGHLVLGIRASGLNTFKIYRVNLTGPTFADEAFDNNLSSLTHAFSTSLLVNADGSGFSAGSSQRSQGSYEGPGVLAWNPDGTPDTEWMGNANASLTQMPEVIDVIPDPTNPQVDKWIVTVDGDGTLTRFNMDGTLDLTFGGTGSVTVPAFQASLPFNSYGQNPLLTHDADGNIYISGGNLYYAYHQGIVKVKPDGTQDMTFGSGDGYLSISPPQAMALQPDGQFLLTGYSARRMSTSGVIDSAYDTAVTRTGLQFDRTVAAPGGRVIAVISNENYLARLNSDGTRDTTWGPNADGNSASFWAEGGAGGQVYNLSVQPDGSFLVTGTREVPECPPCSRLFVSRFNEDGTRDATFEANAPAVIQAIDASVVDPHDMSIDSVVTDAAGRVLIGVTTFNYAASERLGSVYAFNPDGTLDTAFSANLNTNTLGTVGNLVRQRDGRILVGGSFGLPSSHLLRLGGNLPEAPGAPSSLGGTTGPVGGSVTLDVSPALTGGPAAEYYVRYRLAGSVDSWIEYVSPVPLTGTSLGIFGLEGGENYEFQVAAHNASGTSDWVGTTTPITTGYVPAWSSMSGGDTAVTDDGANFTTAMAVGPDGAVYAGGSWSELGGTATDSVARWTGTAWEQLGSNLTGTVNAIVATTDDRIFAGGQFALNGAVAESYLAEWNGSSWVEVPGLNGPVKALASNGAGQLFVGGDFTDAGGIDASAPDFFAILIDGQWSDPQLNLDAEVTALNWSSGQLFVGGNFSGLSGIGCPTLFVYYGFSSYRCIGVESFSGIPTSLAYAGGKLAVAGLSSIDGTDLHGFGLYDFDSETWSDAGLPLTINSGVNPATVKALVAYESLLYIGGNFNEVNGEPISHSFAILDVSTNDFSSMGGGSAMSYDEVGFSYELNEVNVLVADDYGNVYAGGSFSQVYKDPARTRAVVGTAKVARYGMPLIPPGSPTVSAEAGMEAGAVDLTVTKGAGTVPTRYLVRYREVGSSTWITVTQGAPFSGPGISVTGLDSLTDYEFEVAAQNQAGTSAWVATGTITSSAVPVWASMGGGVTAGQSVLALNTHDTGKVYAGGAFTEMGGVAALNVAVWDIATNTWSALGDGLNGTVRALFFRDGVLYAGGDFTSSGSTLASHVAMWDGSSWTQMGGGVFGGTVNTISELGPEGEIYVGGSFDFAYDSETSNISPALVAFDGTDFVDRDTKLTADDEVYTLFSPYRENGTDNYDLVVSGDFGSLDYYVDGAWRSAGIAEWSGGWSTLNLSSNSETSPARGISMYGYDIAVGIGSMLNNSSATGGTAYYSDYDGSWLRFSDFLDGEDVTYATYMDAQHAYFTGDIIGTQANPINHIMMAATGEDDAHSYGEKLYDKWSADEFPFLPLGGGIDGPGYVIAEDSDGNIYVGGVFSQAVNETGVAGTMGVARYGTPIAAPPAQPSISWSPVTLSEAVANDGSITTTSTGTLTGDTFTGTNGDTWSSLVTNVPAGLTAVLTRTSATTVTLAFTGNATSHADADDVSNVSVVFTDDEFTGGSAASVSGSSTTDLAIDFADPADEASPVTLASSTPADGATGVALSADIVLTFSEGIAWGEGGVYLKKSSDDSTVASFTSGSAAGLATIATNLLTLDPVADLEWDTDYYVSIDSDAIASSSTAGTYAGIADATTLNFTTAVQPSISWSPVTLSEAVANDGSITTTSTGTLTGDTFTGTNGDTWSSLVSNVPAGLTAVLTRTSATTVTLAFTGNATSHADADDVSNVSVVFTDDEFAGGSAVSVSGSSTTDLAIDFADPAPGVPAVVSYSSSTLFEAAANDGSVGTVVTVTLSGETFTGADGDDWSELVGNVPDGLTAVLTRVDATHLSLSLGGNATDHADADSVSDLTVELGDAEFTGGDASGVTGATRNLVIDFADPGMPTGTAIKVEVKVSIGSRLNDSDAELTGNGLMPDAEYTFEMHSTVITLASGRTDALGAIHTTVTLPPGVCVEPGVHELILTSTGPDGTPVQAVTYVTLGGSCTVWSKSAVTVTQLVVDDILFPFRTARLDKKAQKRLRALAPLLRGAEGIVIYGYTQTNLRNDSKTLKLINKRLGKQRARVVADYLRTRGVNVQIKVLGRGAVLPKRKSAKYQWMNRRAAIVARFPAPTPD